MAEQIVPRVRRASRMQPPASAHYVGHQAGIHPEDDLYWTGDQTDTMCSPMLSMRRERRSVPGAT